MKLFNRVLLLLVISYACFGAVLFLQIAEQYSFFHRSEGRWTLVWNDDFDGPALDHTKWVTVDRSCGFNSYENDLQALLHENVTVKNGCLVIVSKKEDWIGPDSLNYGQTVVRHYTSGHIFSRDISWTYGRFEVRAKPPVGQGLLTYMLLYPVDGDYTKEIYLMTMPGYDPFTVHFGKRTDHKSNYWGMDFSRIHDGQDYSADFHTYAIEWEPGTIRWYLDGVKVFHVNQDVSKTPSSLNLGTIIGGVSAGEPYDDPKYGGRVTDLPQYFLIDWVRVYQRR